MSPLPSSAESLLPHHLLRALGLPGGGAALQRHRELPDRHRHRSVGSARLLPLHLHAGPKEATLATQHHW